MRLNKKLKTCFFLILFITLIGCCTVSASDNTDTTAATTTNEVTNVQTVEQSNTNNNIGETTTSTAQAIQSENNTIEETADQNDVDDKNNNVKAINKTKTSTLKGVQTSLNSSGTITLNDDVVLANGITLSGDLTINGNGHTITYTGSGNLFEAGAHAITLNDVTVTGVNGYVINGGKGHTLISSIFDKNNGLYYAPRDNGNDAVYLTMINCMISNLQFQQ